MEDTLKLMMDRQSSRVPFDPDKKVEQEALAQILEAGSWAPTAHNMQNFEIIAVDDKELLGRIGNIPNPISLDFIKENYRQLSFSQQELEKKKVGILASGFPPAWVTPQASQGIVPDSGAAPTVGRLVQACSVLLIMLYDPARRAPASEGDFLGIISLGCMLENMWLMAQSLGVGFHVMSMVGSPAVETELRSLLNIPANFKVALSCRLGYPAREQAGDIRVRRDLEDFAHHNKYGNKGIE